MRTFLKIWLRLYLTNIVMNHDHDHMLHVAKIWHYANFVLISYFFSIISFFETTWLTIVLDQIVGYYFPEWEVLRTQIWRQNLKFHDSQTYPCTPGSRNLSHRILRQSNLNQWCQNFNQQNNNYSQNLQINKDRN